MISLFAIKRQENQPCHDPQEHTDVLNTHFANVGPKLASNIPNRNKLFSQYLPKLKFSGSFSFEPVLPTETRNTQDTIYPFIKMRSLYSRQTSIDPYKHFGGERILPL